MNKLRSLITWMATSPTHIKVLLAVFIGLSVLVISVGASAPPPDQQQPIIFNHKAMVSKGISCLYCHSGAMRSETAGIPSVQKCMGCHKSIARDKPEVAKLIEYWNQQKTISWLRVNTLPRFVHFSHQVHVAGGGLNCENCHGDVGQMTIDKQVNQMNMGWCLDCHKKQTNALQLISCETCHK
jgi:hypothetical protein